MSVDWAVVSGFKRLFAGNPNAYGLCLEGAAPTAVREPVGDLAWSHHLYGDRPIGIYPIDPRTGHVKWGCVDIDEGYEDSLIHARNLIAVLARFNITGWMEPSRSKGYHVWVFMQATASATIMRHALKAACKIAGCPDKEVNPKQLAGETELGNFVRIPYPLDSRPDRQRVGGFDGHAQFLHMASFHSTPLQLLMVLADLYTPPVKTPVVIIHHFNGPDYSLEARRGGLTYTIFQNGPLEGSDRSSTMFRLASKLREEGFSPAEVFALMQDYDLRHGKFHGRLDGERRLLDLVEKVFS